MENMIDTEEYMDMRRKLRQSGRRIAYDCINLKQVSSDRVVCSKGRKFLVAKDGSLSLEAVLMGYTPKICQFCLAYDGEELDD